MEHLLLIWCCKETPGPLFAECIVPPEASMLVMAANHTISSRLLLIQHLIIYLYALE